MSTQILEVNRIEKSFEIRPPWHKIICCWNSSSSSGEYMPIPFEDYSLGRMYRRKKIWTPHLNLFGSETNERMKNEVSVMMNGFQLLLTYNIFHISLHSKSDNNYEQIDRFFHKNCTIFSDSRLCDVIMKLITYF